MYTPPEMFEGDTPADILHIPTKKRYDDFTVHRGGYWAGMLTLIFINALIGAATEHNIHAELFYTGVASFFQLVLTAARARDAGLNGWWCLVSVIPFAFLYFGCIRPDEHPKKLRAIEKLRVHDQQGYTLIELLIVAAVVAILAGIAYATYGWAIDRARVAATIGDLGEIHMQVQMFDLNNRRHPTSLAEIGMDGMIDPWGNEYQYLSFDNVQGNGPKRKNRGMVPVNTSYDVYSMGPDGETATPFTSVSARDDIVMAVDGAFFGKVGEFE